MKKVILKHANLNFIFIILTNITVKMLT